MILYQCPPNAPIICLQKQGYPAGEGYHFCLYIRGDGNDPYFLQNGQWTTDETHASSHQVIDSGFNGSADPIGTVRTLYQVYTEGSPHYVRPSSGIFRVTFKG